LGSIIYLIFTSTLLFGADTATFKGSDTSKDGTPLILMGKITKPEDKGPFPAIVLLHGCGGNRADRDDLWAKRLAN
jgi:dienelactone hydrolase